MDTSFRQLAQIVAVGIGAGLASALLFVAVFTGTFFAPPLFALSALPIGLATFGWGPLAGGLAAVVSAATLALAEQPTMAALFGLLIGGPALWVALVASQPTSVVQAGQHRVASYRPLSEVLIHAAGIIALAIVALGVLMRFDAAVASRAFLDAFVRAAPALPDVTPAELREQIEPVARLLFSWLPLASAPLLMTPLILNTWLAARVTALSGRLERPWTPLPTTRLPRAPIVALLVAIAGSFLPGGIGLAFNVVAGAAGFALALAGLAALHTVTLGRTNRTLALGLTYTLTFMLTVPILLWMLLGILDSTTDFRQRYAGANRQT